MAHWQEHFRAAYGPWAVVAGASEGLGAEWATQLAALGLNLVIIARRADRLDELANKIKVASQVDVRVVPLDLAMPDIGDVVTAATADIDIGLLVYNAARSVIGTFLDQPLADHFDEIQVNVRAPLTLAHTLGKRFVARGHGGIILMSSLSATMGSSYIANYAATKAYNLVLAEGLWEELRTRGVDVLACSAGAVGTPNYAASQPQRNQASMLPQAVVAETLPQLGKVPSFIPGQSNRLAAFALRRLMPRRATIKLMGGVMRGMYAKKS